ncbi:MAG TPA: nuclear transport factor 2 family protein [Gemmatimonadales bacterium]|nr:nuclear transport factor 2 family protein [Gemmatimonadales bacterium]
MSTRNVIESYFKTLETRNNWQSLLADDMVFTSFTIPNKQITGKAAYLEGTKRFYSMIQSFEVRSLMVEGSKACALTRYQLKGPRGVFQSDVAEIYTVRDGKIESLGIYFDTAPFPT